MTRRLHTLAVVALAGACLGPPPAAAQIPDSFMNLQVLPKDISRRQIVGIMRNFAGGLGVRCSHCHVGPDNLEGMDFATDSKDTKKAARAMLRMTRTMNAEYLATLPGDEPRQEITCLTCHRRSAKPPQPLPDILVTATTRDGAPAAIKEYQQLRSTELDTGRYDFTSGSVIRAATALLDDGKAAEALALAQQGRELFADSASYHVFVGQLCAQQKQTECAETSLKRALELDPQNAEARRAMEALKKAPGHP